MGQDILGLDMPIKDAFRMKVMRICRGSLKAFHSGVVQQFVLWEG